MTDVMKWLQEVRKLDGALLSAMRVQARDNGTMAAFPYLRDGKPYAAKFRTIDKRFSSTKGVSRGFYNADALTRDKDQPIVITEGEIDCLTVLQSGFLRAVSLPDGWPEPGASVRQEVFFFDPNPCLHSPNSFSAHGAPSDSTHHRAQMAA